MVDFDNKVLNLIIDEVKKKGCFELTNSLAIEEESYLICHGISITVIKVNPVLTIYRLELA